MSTFDVQKNLIAVLGAMTLAVLMGFSQTAHAEQTTSPETFLNETAEIPTDHEAFVFGDGDVSELRKLLSTPDLNAEKQRQLHRALDAVPEEMA